MTNFYGNNNWGGGNVQNNTPQPMSMSVVTVTDPQTVHSYCVAPNNCVLFIDFNANRFYIKSTNAYGVQNPTRSFQFTEDTPQIQNQQNGGGVSREEFEAQQKKLDDLTKLLEDLTSPNK